MSAEVESAAPIPSHEEDFAQDLNGAGDLDDEAESLFGDDDEQPDEHNDLHRKLDDSELDSADDEGRKDRLAATVEDDEPLYDEQKQLKLLDVDIARVKPPEGDELFLANIPDFLGIKHKEFDYATYEPPTKPHDGREPSEGSKFSAFSTANTSIFWRRDPKNPEQLQSNSRIIRWSDGSLTLQIASKPTEQYRISTTAMRPGWPRKTGSSQNHHDQYDPSRPESNNFLGAPHATSGCDLQIVAPFDASIKIQPTGDTANAAELKLKESIAASKEQIVEQGSIRSLKEDPERAKKQAEKAEKDVAKATRKREAAVDRLTSRKDRVLGRSGLGRSAGLSVGDLEDDMGTSRGKRAMPKKRRSGRGGEILSDSDEDEDAYHRRGREDDYDMDDGFLAGSDEEEEEDAEEEDDPDNDDLDIQGRQTVVKDQTRGGARNRDRERTPKRPREEDDDDAEAEDDPDAKGPVKRKQPRVADDSDSN